MNAVLERFIAHSPMAVAVRGAFEYALVPAPLDDPFVRTVGHRDDRRLLFSTCVDLMAAVVCRVKPSIRAAYQAEDHIPVNVTAVSARLVGGWSGGRMAEGLVGLARGANLGRYRKATRGPKKPKPPRTRFPDAKHIATPRLLNGEQT